MAVRELYYLACDDCNNQFSSQKWGAYYSSPDEVSQIATAEGWRLDVPVSNGSKWDFCPRCHKQFVEEQTEPPK